MFKILFIVIFIYSNIFAFLVERRNSKKVYNSYFIVPLTVKIEGIGKAFGIGMMAQNVFKTDIDIFATKIRGDFESTSVGWKEMPLYYSNNFDFLLNAVYFEFKDGGISKYKKGRDSKKEDEMLFKIDKAKGIGGELSISTPDKQFKAYVGLMDAYVGIGSIKNKKTDRKILSDYTTKSYQWRTGLTIDDTDDRIDPRLGYRINIERQGEKQQDNKKTADDTYSDSISITAYIPIVNEQNIFVANFFKSRGVVSRSSNAYNKNYKLDKNNKDSQKFLDELENDNKKNNKKGTAVSLGGPNRLRSYPVGRFSDVHSVFFGFEYRMYFLDRWKPFNAMLWKGINTGIQIAVFHEYGQVNETDDGDLYRDMKTSTGVGLRIIFTDAILRLDWAKGKEGTGFNVFYGYAF